MIQSVKIFRTMAMFLIVLLVYFIPLSAQRVHNFDLYYATLDRNNLLLTYNNIGTLDSYRIPSRWSHVVNAINPIFDHGLNAIGKINDSIRVIMNYWQSPFSPGPIVEGLPAIYIPYAKNSRYRPYKITIGDTLESNPDLAKWPADLGAPVTSEGRPRLFGEQMLWSVYNGADRFARGFYPTGANSDFVTLPLEIRQSVYTTQNQFFNFIDDVVFLEFEMINKGTVPIDSLFFGFWTDIDVNSGSWNISGIDTLLNVAYTWTGKDTLAANQYPITIGYALLQGPQSVSPGSTAVFGDRRIADKKNLPMTSFWRIGDDSGGDNQWWTPPYSIASAWNVARGLHKDGSRLFDSTTGRYTNFIFSGDPVTGQGWIDSSKSLGGGAGLMFYSGPVTMAPLDTQWMMIAVIATLGDNNKQSITQLRQKTTFLREMNVTDIRGTGFKWKSTVKVPPVPRYHALHRNYPNPFNPATTIPFDVAYDTHVMLEIFNIVGQKVATLVNNRMSAGSHEVTFSANGLASGMYLCRLTVDYFSLNQKIMYLK